MPQLFQWVFHCQSSQCSGNWKKKCIMKLKIKMCFSFGALYYFQILQNYANETHSTCIYSIVFPKNLNQVLGKNKDQITPLFLNFKKNDLLWWCRSWGLGSAWSSCHGGPKYFREVVVTHDPSRHVPWPNACLGSKHLWKRKWNLLLIVPHSFVTEQKVWPCLLKKNPDADAPIKTLILQLFLIAHWAKKILKKSAN